MLPAENSLNNKVKSDTENQVNSFNETRRLDRINSSQRKVVSQVKRAGHSSRKDLRDTRVTDNLSFLDYGDNQKIVFVLGLTLSLVNDFFDLVFWQNPLLLGQVFDITGLFLLLLLLVFWSRNQPITVFLIIFIFILEIVPVLGVIPFWTIGMALWYWGNRR